MSQFPRRLIDELGEGDARRLLDSGRSDEPPARLVAAAILTATKSTSAAENAPESSDARTAGASHRRRNLALAVGALVIGAAAVVASTREPSSASASTSTSTSTTPADDYAGTDRTLAEPAATASAEGTSVTALPDAPVAPRVETPTAKTAAVAEDLLREANRLRARGQWAEAAATYRKVIELGPDSAEAYPADVALGNLELQQNRPPAALARYEHALARHPNGALAEEARWGKARALRASGRVAEERAALEDFRTRHPDSPLVAVATQRLAEIGN